ncbi:MAG: bifunctional phosphopantothenoylcysteine decarboxylase/phosphopantothenate--cysteine ligase CoaBC [Nocardioidaceae bacterium]
MSTSRPRVVLGVSGGIAAYKACELLRRFTESGHDVTVVPTESALKFVGAATWEALSGHPVASGIFSRVDTVQHVRLGQSADLLVIAPATADLMARAVHGRADDLLAATLLTARCPVVIAPAMHTEMWEHPATLANVDTLRERGVLVIDPAYGRLTGSDTGPGRLPEPNEIFEIAVDVLRRGQDSLGQDLRGRTVVISAGGTREFLDPVRYLGNRSSGKQGYALARAAVARGADVTLIAANVDLPDPAGAKVVPVVSTRDLHEAVLAAAADADVVVMAAAPADFRPASRVGHKIKKQADGAVPDLVLVENPDILADLVSRREAGTAPVLVGFAAETGDSVGSALDHARAKLSRKGCDLLVFNDVSGGAVFGQEHNQAVILGADGTERSVPHGSKIALAHVVWDLVAQWLADTGPHRAA